MRTRLAPSPTGALHLGNARTFLVTWALARRLGWSIVLRIEDIDGPRVKPGAIEATIETLAWLGIDWDEGPHIQSAELEPSRDAMRRLASAGLAYPCERTRTEIEAAAGIHPDDSDAAIAASAPQEGARESVYPVALRPPLFPRDFGQEDVNWRFATPPETVQFTDSFAGPQSHNPAAAVGDFLVWTKRSQPSYQLAVVVDDHRQGITEVVRGDDLLDSAARQILLARALGLPSPRYTHLPLVRGADGRRLAKRHGDTRIDAYRQRGASAARTIGLCAFWCGCTPARSEMSAAEFRDRLDLRTMPHGSAVFGPEDDAWLLG